MNAKVIADLRGHLDLCRELLRVVEREGQALRGAEEYNPYEYFQARKTLLPRLDESLTAIKTHRLQWQRLTPDEQSRFPEIPTLIRQNQDLVMKIIVQDRENEQGLLRRGLVPPKHLPPVNRQRPNYVANLYKRQGGS